MVQLPWAVLFLSALPGSLPPDQRRLVAATASRSGQVQSSTPLVRGYRFAVRQDERQAPPLHVRHSLRPTVGITRVALAQSMFYPAILPVSLVSLLLDLSQSAASEGLHHS